MATRHHTATMGPTWPQSGSACSIPQLGWVGTALVWNQSKYDQKIIKKWPWKKFKDFLQWRDDKHNFQYNYQIWNDIVNDMQLRRYLIDILDGKYSMTLGTDKIIVEEKLVAWEWFKEFCEYGLADIRIIVFNLVPVAAMIRVPTSKSKGKANLAAWWIGFGINVWTWRINSMLNSGTGM